MSEWDLDRVKNNLTDSVLTGSLIESIDLEAFEASDDGNKRQRENSVFKGVSRENNPLGCRRRASRRTLLINNRDDMFLEEQTFSQIFCFRGNFD